MWQKKQQPCWLLVSKLADGSELKYDLINDVSQPSALEKNRINFSGLVIQRNFVALHV
jgi:hypothetical protein